MRLQPLPRLLQLSPQLSDCRLQLLLCCLSTIQVFGTCVFVIRLGPTFLLLQLFVFFA
jgi:hypothetical protein